MRTLSSQRGCQSRNRRNRKKNTGNRRNPHPRPPRRNRGSGFPAAGPPDDGPLDRSGGPRAGFRHLPVPGCGYPRSCGANLRTEDRLISRRFRQFDVPGMSYKTSYAAKHPYGPRASAESGARVGRVEGGETFVVTRRRRSVVTRFHQAEWSTVRGCARRSFNSHQSAGESRCPSHVSKNSSPGVAITVMTNPMMLSQAITLDSVLFR